MPRRFVRESKFRHVFGEPFKKHDCYENIDISKNTWDGGRYCAVNSKFLAVVLEGYGGGCFILLNLSSVGRIEANSPKFSGHTGKVLDIQFNPFNAHVIASAGEDSRIKVWTIPENGLTSDITKATVDLVGHRKKVGIIKWHPTANNILASAGFDFDVIIWDVERGSPVTVISGHQDVINCLSWNGNGSLLATTCKDKFTRIIDPRKSEVLNVFSAHSGSKPSRVHFIDENRLLTVGCSKDSSREISLWNKSDLSEPIIKHELDQGSGNMLVEYDDVLNIVYVAAKGDCNIRYYEISRESPYIHFLSQYSSTTPQRGFGVLPKRAVNVNKCEIFRLYKLCANGLCEPISMVVPRKSDCYQPDIYPSVAGDTAALTADQWFKNENADPILISLQDGFIPTKKEFTVQQVQAKDENIFEVNKQSAPKREEDLRKAFYQQQDEIQKLRDLLKGKELRIRQLEYENSKLNKENVTLDDIVEESLQKNKKNLKSGMIQYSDNSEASEGSSSDPEIIEENRVTVP